MNGPIETDAGVPGAACTDAEVASVGLTETVAREAAMGPRGGGAIAAYCRRLIVVLDATIGGIDRLGAEMA